MSDKKITKAQLCSRTKIARTTLDAVLNGSDAKISTIESLANALGVPISCFFDDSPSKEVTQTSHGDNSPNVLGNGNRVSVSSSIDRAVEEFAQQRKLMERSQEEITEQRKLVAKSQEQVSKTQEQIDRLITLIERMQMT